MRLRHYVPGFLVCSGLVALGAALPSALERARRLGDLLPPPPAAETVRVSEPDLFRELGATVCRLRLRPAALEGKTRIGLFLWQPEKPEQKLVAARVPKGPHPDGWHWEVTATAQRVATGPNDVRTLVVIGLSIPGQSQKTWRELGARLQSWSWTNHGDGPHDPRAALTLLRGETSSGGIGEFEVRLRLDAEPWPE